MATPSQRIRTETDSTLQRLFAGAFGALLGLALLKFGNPVVMAEHVDAPADVYEWVFFAWPPAWANVVLPVVGVLGILAFRRRPPIRAWLLVAPLPWFVWQLVSATGSMDSTLTARTLVHFASNVGCFYLGLLCLSAIRDLSWFWAGLTVGFVLVLLSGWGQHFGGLEATRAIFWSEVYPQLKGKVSADLLKRMSSDRIFATLFYPNTLAGAILLLTPVSIGTLPAFVRSESAQRIGRLLTVVLAAGCLLWSGSKAGWLIALALILVGLFRMRFSPTLKLALAVAVLAAGTVGFLWKYSGYLQRGATSAAARLDYWEAAMNITITHPVRGTGPGTFGEAYAKVKRPESEMARLAHNDYLQQASDSGFPGGLFFAGFVGACMIYIGKRVWKSADAVPFWIWLGLLGICLQSLTEFGLYVAAISWPTMTLLGWLTARAANDLDIRKPPNLTSRNQ